MEKFNEDIIYCGVVVKRLSKGKIGFIRSLRGDDVFFNRSSFTDRRLSLRVGNAVSFKVKYMHDEETGQDNPVAAELSRF